MTAQNGILIGRALEREGISGLQLQRWRPSKGVIPLPQIHKVVWLDEVNTLQETQFGFFRWSCSSCLSLLG